MTTGQNCGFWDFTESENNPKILRGLKIFPSEKNNGCETIRGANFSVPERIRGVNFFESPEFFPLGPFWKPAFQ